jgi:hypothetical protein
MSAFLLVGYEGLASERTTSLSLLHPALRFLFPFILFGQLAGIALVIRGVIYRQYLKLLWPLIFVVLSFVLTNQRGILVTGVLLGLALAIAFTRITKKRSFLYCFVLLFVTLNMKLVNTFIMSSGSGESFEFMSFIDGPDGAQLQVWSILLSYLETHSHTLGGSMAAGVLGLVPHSLRILANIPSVTDILNMFYSPDEYLYFGFGFNGTLTHDAFLSFGWFGLFLSVPVAFVIARGIAIVKTSAERGSFFIAVITFFGLNTFMGSGFQVLHWYLVPLTIWLMSRLFRVRI